MMRSPRSSTLSHSGVLPGSRWNSVNVIDRCPLGPRTMTLASNAANATATSEGVRGHALVRPCEDGVQPIQAIAGRTARTGPAFVAREIIFVAKVGTTRTLHDVAPH